MSDNVIDNAALLHLHNLADDLRCLWPKRQRWFAAAIRLEPVDCEGLQVMRIADDCAVELAEERNVSVGETCVACVAHEWRGRAG